VNEQQGIKGTSRLAMFCIYTIDGKRFGHSATSFYIISFSVGVCHIYRCVPAVGKTINQQMNSRFSSTFTIEAEIDQVVGQRHLFRYARSWILDSSLNENGITSNPNASTPDCWTIGGEPSIRNWVTFRWYCSTRVQAFRIVLMCTETFSQPIYYTHIIRAK
jgi:hypothetical protein